MNWPSVALRKVAPPDPSTKEFQDDEIVWHLTLDQIEGGTGEVKVPLYNPAKDAGNSTYVFDEGNVLYSKLRPYLNKAVCPDDPGIATSELIPLRPIGEVLDRKYLTYFLLSQQFLNFTSSMVAGAKMPRIIMAKFWDYTIPLPPISEQRRIVEILDQADALRKKRAEADEKAARILPALFYKMFGDPATNPKGWDVCTLEDAISDTRNGIYKPKEYYGSGVGILKMFNIQDGTLNLARVDQIDVTPKELDTYSLKPGDIFINRVNTPELVGKCAVITEDLGTAVFESKNIRIRIKEDIYTPEYVASYLNSPFGHQSLRSSVKHAIGMATINNSDLRRTPFFKPALALQMEWSHFVIGRYELRKKSMLSAEQLDALFSNLSYMAFKGNLTSKWRESHLKELLLEMEEQTKLLNVDVES